MQDSSSPNSPSARKLAFTAAYNAHVVFFLKYFKGKTRNQEDAEDLSQELWESVYTTFAPNQFNHIKLLQRKAQQVFLAYNRKKNVRSFLLLAKDVPEMPDTRPDRWDGTAEDERRIWKSFWERFPGVDLTETQKTVFWLKVWHGYTLSELAEKYKKPISTIQDSINKVKQECAASANKEQP